MTDNAVFLVTELWLIPGSFEKLKNYRKKINDILEKYKPETLFHNHAFEWVYGGEEGDYPTGIEIIKFENEQVARAALAALRVHVKITSHSSTQKSQQMVNKTSLISLLKVNSSISESLHGEKS